MLSDLYVLCTCVQPAGPLARCKTLGTCSHDPVYTIPTVSFPIYDVVWCGQPAGPEMAECKTLDQAGAVVTVVEAGSKKTLGIPLGLCACVWSVQRGGQATLIFDS